MQPIHFGSPDGLPTGLFFLLGCQTDNLHLLARLCLMVQKTELLAQLRAGPDAAMLHDHLLGVEQLVIAAAGGTPGASS